MILKHKTAVSKNVYFDVLEVIVNKYNSTVHRTTKMEPINVTSNSYPEYNEDSNEKDSKFKVGDHVRISKYKNVFAKRYTQNWSEEVFVVSKIKNTIPWTFVISALNGKPITGSFYEKELQKSDQQKFRIAKLIKRKEDKLYAKWKGYDHSFNSCFDKKGTWIDTSTFALKSNLASLKTEFDNLDIDKLVQVPDDLSKLRDVVKNDVVKKAMYDKLATKVNNIDTHTFVLKTKYQTDKTELEKKIPDVTNFLKKKQNR